MEEEEDEPLDLGAILKKRRRTVEGEEEDDDDDDDDDLDEDEDEDTGRKFIIDSNKAGQPGGVSGRELVASMMRFGKGENTWVRPALEKSTSQVEDSLDDSGGQAPEPPEAALAKISSEALDAAAKATTSFRRAAFDIDLDGLDDKPWQRPDADPSDYFNYGMNEATWRAYVKQQLIVRRELQERRSKFASAAKPEVLGFQQKPPRMPPPPTRNGGHPLPSAPQPPPSQGKPPPPQAPPVPAPGGVPPGMPPRFVLPPLRPPMPPRPPPPQYGQFPRGPRPAMQLPVLPPPETTTGEEQPNGTYPFPPRFPFPPVQQHRPTVLQPVPTYGSYGPSSRGGDSGRRQDYYGPRRHQDDNGRRRRDDRHNGDRYGRRRERSRSRSRDRDDDRRRDSRDSRDDDRRSSKRRY